MTILFWLAPFYRLAQITLQMSHLLSYHPGPANPQGGCVSERLLSIPTEAFESMYKRTPLAECVDPRGDAVMCPQHILVCHMWKNFAH